MIFGFQIAGAAGRVAGRRLVGPGAQPAAADAPARRGQRGADGA